jgi:hypothetical protein
MPKLEFKYLREKICGYCGETYIPGDPQFPESDRHFCRSSCREISNEIDAAIRKDNAEELKRCRKPLKKRGKLRGDALADRMARDWELNGKYRRSRRKRE